MPAKENQSKTSKTARVMNLLSKKPEPGAAADASAVSTSVPPIMSSLAPDAEASVQIKNALENELAGASAAPSQPAAAEPQPENAPAEPVQSAPEVPEPVQPEASEPVQPEQADEHRFAEPENPGYINVMQVLVEEKAPKYIEMFGLCKCRRCLEDVKALTLNHLPPKYVVLAPGDRVPRLTVYEGRYSSDITAQLLHACTFVMKRPHHGR